MSGNPKSAHVVLALRHDLIPTLRLAAPIIAVLIGGLMMGTVDTLMLGRLSKEALAAAALGNAVSFGLFAPAFGMIMAIDPLISQAHGAGDRDAVSRHLLRGVTMTLVLSVACMGGLWYLGPRLHWLRQTEEIVPLAADYLRGVTPGVLGFLLYFLLRQTLQAVAVIRPALIAVVVANLVNVLANYCLVFGGFGAPALGVLGSGLATSISRWVLLLTLLVAAWPTRSFLFSGFRGVGWLGRALRPTAFADLARLGLPISLHQSAEFWVFTVVALMMGSLGATEFAGHQIALNLASLTFMVPLGVAGAGATRVGNAIGRRDLGAARRAAMVSVLLGALVMLLSAALFAAIPEWLGRLYSPQPEVIAAAALLIPIAAVFQVADGLQVVAAGVLRGAADTLLPAVLALVGFWAIGLPFGWWLAFSRQLGPVGLWWGLTLGLSVTAILLLMRAWRRLRLPLEQLRAETS